MAKLRNIIPRPKATTKVQDIRFKPETCVLYKNVRKMMRIFRWAGFFPVDGLQHSTITTLKFNSNRIYRLFYLFTLLGQATYTVTTFLGFALHLTMILFTHFVFAITISVIALMILRLARHWPVYLKEIADIEDRITFKLDKHIARYNFLFILAILIIGGVEHLLRVMYLLDLSIKYLELPVTNYDAWDVYFTIKFHALIGDGPVPVWCFVSAIILEFSFTQAIFLWTFADVFVMSHSIYLAAYFKTFNKIVQTEKGNPLTDWGRLRAQHSLLVILTKKIHLHLAYFVLISFSTNIYWGIYQLFNSLVEGIDTIHDIFFAFSFMFMIIRTLAVSVLAASVNKYAQEPISALGEVHASKYSIEIKRFYRQLKYTDIGVSGVFFTVTRGMMLKILCMLVTYELVLLQLDHNTPWDEESSYKDQHCISRGKGMSIYY